MGQGYFAHRDGYNVLYGDWSASWYGDPQERIMWWPDPQGGSGAYWYSPAYGLGANAISDFYLPYWSTPDVRWPAFGEPGKGTVAVWHIFDENHGVDVGVDMPPH